MTGWLVRFVAASALLATGCGGGCSGGFGGLAGRPIGQGGAGGAASDGGGGDGSGPGASGGANGGGLDGAAGVTVVPPDPPPGSTLAVCGATALPGPLGFDALGRTLVVVALPGNQAWVRAWDTATDAVTEVIPPVPAVSVELSADGARVLVSDAGSFRVFDLAAGRFVTDDAVQVDAVDWSADGTLVLDGSLARWTAAGARDLDFAPQLAARFGAMPGDVLGAALAPDGGSVAVVLPARFVDGGADAAIAIVRAVGAPTVLPDRIALQPWRLDFAPDGRHLAVWAPGGASRVWDVQTGQRVLDAQLFDELRTARFTASSTLLEVQQDGSLWERQPATGFSIEWGAVTPGRGDVLTPLAALDRTSSRILFVGVRGQAPAGLRVIREKDGAVDGVWRQGVLPTRGSYDPPAPFPTSWPGAVAVDDAAIYAMEHDWDFGSGTYQVMVAKYPAAGGPRQAVFQPGEAQSEWEGQIALSPDGQRLAVVFPDSVRVLDAATLALQATLATQAGSVAWSPDGHTLATTPQVHYRDPGRSVYAPTKQVWIWNASTWQLASNYGLPVVPITVGFDGGGDRLFGDGYDNFQVSGSSSPTDPQDFIFGGGGAFELDISAAQNYRIANPPLRAAGGGLGATISEVIALGGDPISTLEHLLAPSSGPRRRWAAFSGDRSTLAGMMIPVQGELAMGLFAVSTGKLIASLPPALDDQELMDVAVSRDGRRIAVSKAGAVVYCLK